MNECVTNPIEHVDMLPILGIGDEKDERFKGVILLESDSETKQTAEDCGIWWFIRDWEISNVDDVNYWFCRSSFTITNSTINKLATYRP